MSRPDLYSMYTMDVAAVETVIAEIPNLSISIEAVLQGLEEILIEHVMECYTQDDDVPPQTLSCVQRYIWPILRGGLPGGHERFNETRAIAAMKFRLRDLKQRLEAFEEHQHE